LLRLWVARGERLHEFKLVAIRVFEERDTDAWLVLREGLWQDVKYNAFGRKFVNGAINVGHLKGNMRKALPGRVEWFVALDQLNGSAPRIKKENGATRKTANHRKTQCLDIKRSERCKMWRAKRDVMSACDLQSHKLFLFHRRDPAARSAE
jgi:hypothetical protein